MRLDFNDYISFMVVAQEQNFARAAVRLGLSPSTLSHIIRRLEERMSHLVLCRIGSASMAIHCRLTP